MEACATEHHWARELIALGHIVKLMPQACVKAYVKRNKKDTADAEAICEAVTRSSMRFVPVKDVEQQSVLVLHRARRLLVRQRTMLVNALRAHMAECHFNFAQAVTFQSCADISLGGVSGESANCLSPERGPSSPS
jgi:transposase